MQRNDNNAAPKHFPKSWCFRRLVQAAGHHLLKTTTPLKVVVQGIKANFVHCQLLLCSFIFQHGKPAWVIGLLNYNVSRRKGELTERFWMTNMNNMRRWCTAIFLFNFRLLPYSWSCDVQIQLMNQKCYSFWLFCNVCMECECTVCLYWKFILTFSKKKIQSRRINLSDRICHSYSWSRYCASSIRPIFFEFQSFIGEISLTIYMYVAYFEPISWFCLYFWFLESLTVLYVQHLSACWGEGSSSVWYTYHRLFLVQNIMIDYIRWH